MAELLSVRLRVDSFPDDTFVVERFRGREALNELYDFEVRLRCRLEEDQILPALGRAAHLEWSAEPDARVFHGVVASLRFEERSRDANGAWLLYTIRLVPRAWLMSLRKSSRIFQAKAIDEVIREVLALHAIPSRWLVSRTLPRRAYCTQYEETDLGFVMRLAAEAGLHFHFEQPRDESAAAASAIGQIVDAGIGAVAGALGGTDPTAGLAGMFGGIIGWAGGLREVMVFSDAPTFYPPVPVEGGADWTEQLAQHARQIGQRAIGAAVDQATEALGQVSAPLGEVGGALFGAAQDALGRELSSGQSRELSYRPRLGMAPTHGDTVLELTKQRKLHSLATTYRIYDPDRPQAVLSAHEREEGGIADLIGDLLDGHLDPSQLAQQGLGAAGDLAQALGGPAGGLVDQGLGFARNALADGSHGLGAEIYEHQGHFLFPDWDHDKEEPKRMLAAAKRDGAIARGTTLCPWLAAGHRFHLVDHPLPSLSHEQVVVSLEHEATLDASTAEASEQNNYRNRLVCVPADVHYVPARPPRRFVQVCQTATVVGTSEIDTDERGQICVRFHWDRRSSASPHATCRIRTMQSWANAGYGTQFIPRVGSEVVVGFDGGDPDRPIVLGSVYNAVSPPPFALPRHKAVSGIRTQSTPGGDGGSELSFDDTLGREVLRLAAQRDLVVTAGGERALTVDRDDRETVRGDRHVEIGGTLHTRLRAGRETDVASRDSLTVEGSRVRTTLGSSMERVEGSRTVEVAGSSSTFVRGMATLTADGDVVQRVKGNLVQVIGGGDGARAFAVRAEGDFNLAASQQGGIVADGGLVLQCGNSSIHLSPDQIYITSPDILLESGGGRLHLGRESSVLTSDDQIIIKANEVITSSSGATVGLTSEASIQGSKVLLNSPASGDAPAEDRTVEPTTIVLKDQRGEPIPNHPFRIIRPDGSEIGGTVDAQGRAVLSLEEDAVIVFPGLRNPRGGS